MRIIGVLFIAGLLPVQALADDMEATVSPDSKSVAAESSPSAKSPIANHLYATAILPKGLLVPFYALYSENFSDRYLGSGTKEPLLGLKVKDSANIIGAQYGLSKTTTLTFYAPFVTHSEVKINDYDKLRASNEYAAVKAYTSSQLASGFVQAGLCADNSACYSQIANGMTFPVSNAEAGYAAGMPVSSYIGAVSDGYFANNAQKEGTQAMADLKVGVNSQYFQNGALTIKSRSELTLPTGKYEVASNNNPTGAGRYTMDVFGNAEYALHKGAVAVLEHGVSYDLTAAEAEGVKSRHEGLGQRSGLFLLFDPGQFIEPMSFVAFSTSYNVTYLPSQSQKSAAEGALANIPQTSVVYNINKVRFSGVNYGFPLLLDLMKEKPLSGKNVNAIEKNTVVVTSFVPL